MADSPDTFLKAFLANAEKTPNKIFMTQPMGGGAPCKTWTLKEVLDEAKKMAGYIESKGYPKGSKIAICSKNCSWWVMADLAILISGNVTVPVYPTLTHETVSYILEHSESKMIFIGKLDEKPWSEMKSGVPSDMPTVVFPLFPQGTKGEKWDEIIGKTEPIKEMVSPAPEDLCTIIYTSGSTGQPKGVMHNFKSMTIPTQGIVKLFKFNAKDRYLSYLPLRYV
jgi:long-chain acyl-CoA synthetase